MTRLLPLLLSLLPSLMLAACGRNDAPDVPLYTIDQSTPAAAPDPALHGCWSGVLRTSVEPRRLVLAVEARRPPHQVRLISPDQGGAVVNFEQVRLDGRTLAVATPLGAFRFEGALEGADQLSGNVVQGGLGDQLIFTRESGAEPPGC
jgi:hypothetical protein